MSVIKENFYKTAEETGATNCIYFNWDYRYRPWMTCTKHWVKFDEQDKICECSVFAGGKCKYYEKSRELA